MVLVVVIVVVVVVLLMLLLVVKGVTGRTGIGPVRRFPSDRLTLVRLGRRVV